MLLEALVTDALNALITVLTRVLMDSAFRPAGFAAMSEVLAQVMRQAMERALTDALM